MLLAVDPSTRATGWALYQDGLLVQAGVIKARGLEDMIARVRAHPFPEVETLVVEYPQIYLRKRAKGDPNDQIKVALVAGAVAGVVSCQQTLFKTPHDWKGSRPKIVDNPYTLRLLAPSERAVIEGCGVPASLLDNVLDAAGLGLATLRRR